MSNKEFLEGLKREFFGAVTKVEDSQGQISAEFAASAASSIFSYCLNNSSGKYDFLEDLTAYETESDVVVFYNLYSTVFNHRIFLRAPLGHTELKILSASSFWSAAKYYEYEVAELFGVQFKNSSFEPPFLLPADWSGYPLRKDYTYPEGFGGIVHRTERRKR